MNDKLREFAKNDLKSGLSLLSSKQQKLFKRMYSPDNIDLDINKIVDNMDDNKLDWAMQQVQHSVAALS